MLRRSALATGLAAATNLVPATRVGVPVSAPTRVLRRAVLVPGLQPQPPGDRGAERAAAAGGRPATSPALRLPAGGGGAAVLARTADTSSSTPTLPGAAGASRALAAVGAQHAMGHVAGDPATAGTPALPGSSAPVRPAAVPVRRRPAEPTVAGPAALSGAPRGSLPANLPPALAGVLRRSLAGSPDDPSSGTGRSTSSSSSPRGVGSHHQGGPVPSSSSHGARSDSGVPAHVRRFLDDGSSEGADLGGFGVEGSADQPSPRELTDALLGDPESLARLVDAVGDAVERKIVRDLVRQGRAAFPGLV
jgi:hypothetical protein